MNMILGRSIACLILNGLLFTVGKRWVDFVDQKFFGKLMKFRADGRSKLKQSMVCVDKLFLMQQLLKVRILLYLFFFSQIYTNVKGLFFYFINLGKDSDSCLMLYGQVS